MVYLLLHLANSIHRVPTTAERIEAYTNASYIDSNDASNDLIVLVTVAQFERCYVDEWLEYHFALGVTKVYIIPAFGYPTINHKCCHDPRVLKNLWIDDVMRNYTYDHPRVEVVCIVHGKPGSCQHPDAESMQNRFITAQYIVDYFAPHHAGSWLVIFDLDEFLTVPNSSYSLTGALEAFTRLGASYLVLNALTYGTNDVKSNPTCETLRTFEDGAL